MQFDGRECSLFLQKKMDTVILGGALWGHTVSIDCSHDLHQQASIKVMCRRVILTKNNTISRFSNSLEEALKKSLYY